METKEFTNYLEELNNFKGLLSDNLITNKDFLRLVDNVYKLINRNKVTKDLYAKNQRYYVDNIEKINSITKNFIVDFRKNIRNIDYAELDKAKSQNNDKKVFNKVLSLMNIRNCNEAHEAMSAKEMIDCILNYNIEFDVKELYKNNIEGYINNYIENLEKLSLDKFLCRKGISQKTFATNGELLHSTRNELTKILKNEPDKNLVNDFIRMKALLIYKEHQQTDDLCGLYPEYYILMSRIIDGVPIIKSVITECRNVLEQRNIGEVKKSRSKKEADTPAIIKFNGKGFTIETNTEEKTTLCNDKKVNFSYKKGIHKTYEAFIYILRNSDNKMKTSRESLLKAYGPKEKNIRKKNYMFDDIIQNIREKLSLTKQELRREHNSVWFDWEEA